MASTQVKHNPRLPLPSFEQLETLAESTTPKHLTVMSAANGSGGQAPQHPSGGRSTGAAGGANGKFQCRNYQEPGHPEEYIWVDIPGWLCAHCQVSHSSF